MARRSQLRQLLFKDTGTVGRISGCVDAVNDTRLVFGFPLREVIGSCPSEPNRQKPESRYFPSTSFAIVASCMFDVPS